MLIEAQQPGAEDFATSSPFREIDVDELENKGPLYKLMTWAITPRPVALVSTMDEAGVTNVRLCFWLVALGIAH